MMAMTMTTVGMTMRTMMMTMMKERRLEKTEPVNYLCKNRSEVSF